MRLICIANEKKVKTAGTEEGRRAEKGRFKCGSVLKSIDARP
jgi:hypothetical protein